MQAYGHVLLGWHYFPNSARPDYYVPQLRDWKGSLEISTLDPKALAMYAGYCAWTLARAHARSGDRVAIAAYLGGKDAFDQAIADFSAAYADKNERDFARLENAAAVGQIAVERGF
jgi:sugar/nucleoside kinase (ribokinase family)